MLSISDIAGLLSASARAASSTRWRTSPKSARTLVISSRSDSGGSEPEIWSCRAVWASDSARTENRSLSGDMGGEVVKVARPGRGDDARAWAPPYWGSESATFIALNRNKKSLALDLKSPGGLEVLRRLVSRADVFVQSLRPGAIDELGLDFAGTARLNPRIVYCSVTAFGTRGPLRHLPGYDPLMQAYSGLMSINGHPGQEPARVGTSIVDMGTGMWAALGIVAALRQRDASGRAVEVTTALFETALMWVSYQAAGYLASGEVPQPQGSGTAMIAPYQAFPTADGFTMIGAGSDALFARLTSA